MSGLDILALIWAMCIALNMVLAILSWLHRHYIDKVAIRITIGGIFIGLLIGGLLAPGIPIIFMVEVVRAYWNKPIITIKPKKAGK